MKNTNYVNKLKSVTNTLQCNITDTYAKCSIKQQSPVL